LRKQFCASSALSSFHTAWVIRVVSTMSAESPLYPPRTDIISQTDHVGKAPRGDMPGKRNSQNGFPTIGWCILREKPITSTRYSGRQEKPNKVSLCRHGGNASQARPVPA